MEAVRCRKGHAQIAPVAPLPSRPAVRPQPRQRGGGEGEEEEHQRRPRREAHYYPHALDLELPHAGDPDAQRDQDKRQHGEQPPAFEPVLTRRWHDGLPLLEMIKSSFTYRRDAPPILYPSL